MFLPIETGKVVRSLDGHLCKMLHCFIILWVQGRRRGSGQSALSPMKLHYVNDENGPGDGGLESYSLSDAGLSALGEGFPKLEKLSLIWCSNVSSMGLISLAEKCTFLKSLDLQVQILDNSS